MHLHYWKVNLYYYVLSSDLGTSIYCTLLLFKLLAYRYFWKQLDKITHHSLAVLDLNIEWP